MSPLPRLRSLSEGEGATFKYLPTNSVNDGKSIKNIPFVGTVRSLSAARKGCVFCLGLYLPLNASKFFLAHIRPIVPGLDDLGKETIYIHWSRHQGQVIKRKTLQKLRQIEEYENWQIDREAAKQGVVAVCPMLTDVNRYNGNHCTELYILGAVREFLEFPGLLADRNAQGMYVHRRTGNVVKASAGKDQRLDGFNRPSPPEHCDKFLAFKIVGERERFHWDVEVVD